MTDIVEELKKAAENFKGYAVGRQLGNAADEIAHLREMLNPTVMEDEDDA